MDLLDKADRAGSPKVGRSLYFGIDARSSILRDGAQAIYAIINDCLLSCVRDGRSARAENLPKGHPMVTLAGVQSGHAPTQATSAERHL